MKELSYYYKSKKFNTIEEALKYYNTMPSESHPLDIGYLGIVVGYIDIDRLSAEVNRHAKGG